MVTFILLHFINTKSRKMHLYKIVINIPDLILYCLQLYPFVLKAVHK